MVYNREEAAKRAEASKTNSPGLVSGMDAHDVRRTGCRGCRLGESAVRLFRSGGVPGELQWWHSRTERPLD